MHSPLTKHSPSEMLDIVHQVQRIQEALHQLILVMTNHLWQYKHMNPFTFVLVFLVETCIHLFSFSHTFTARIWTLSHVQPTHRHTHTVQCLVVQQISYIFTRKLHFHSLSSSSWFCVPFLPFRIHTLLLQYSEIVFHNSSLLTATVCSAACT